eukprot:3741371-Pleurochrysis_carterae.AAC.1
MEYPPPLHTPFNRRPRGVHEPLSTGSSAFASQADVRAAIEEAYADDDPAFGLKCDRVAENVETLVTFHFHAL